LGNDKKNWLGIKENPYGVNHRGASGIGYLTDEVAYVVHEESASV
jgi:hypothetical protein